MGSRVCFGIITAQEVPLRYMLREGHIVPYHNYTLDILNFLLWMECHDEQNTVTIWHLRQWCTQVSQTSTPLNNWLYNYNNLCSGASVRVLLHRRLVTMAFDMDETVNVWVWLIFLVCVRLLLQSLALLPIGQLLMSKTSILIRIMTLNIFSIPTIE